MLYPHTYCLETVLQEENITNSYAYKKFQPDMISVFFICINIRTTLFCEELYKSQLSLHSNWLSLIYELVIYFNTHSIFALKLTGITLNVIYVLYGIKESEYQSPHIQSYTAGGSEKRLWDGDLCLK